jgi:hypothetical protein
MTSNAIVQKLWNYCNILRDDGLSYQDYIEQLSRVQLALDLESWFQEKARINQSNGGKE